MPGDRKRMNLMRLQPDEVEQLRVMYQPHFDSDWYSQMNEDVRSSGLNPLEHFLSTGELESRSPSPWFITKWVRQDLESRGLDVVRPFRSFLTCDLTSPIDPHPLVSTRVVMERTGAATGASVLTLLSGNGVAGRLSEWWDPSEYVLSNPDLSDIRELEAHFLNRGLDEGRFVGIGLQVVRQEEYLKGVRPDGEPIASLSWNGSRYLIVRLGLPRTVLRQVLAHESIDPRVLAPGAASISGLRIFGAADLRSRDNIDSYALSQLSDETPDVIVVIPRLGIGGAEKYAVQLALILERSYGLETSILVTAVEGAELDEQLRNWRRRLGYSPRAVSFFDIAGKTWRRPLLTALLAIAQKPKMLFVFNDDAGYTAIAEHGRALSTQTALVSGFFSQSPLAQGAPYAARYLEEVAQYGWVLTDNSAFLGAVKERLDEACLQRTVVLPPWIGHEDPTRGAAERSVMHARWSASGIRRFIWIGRWEGFKNVEVLRAVSNNLSHVQFDVFSPDRPSDWVEWPTNVKFHGHIQEIETFDLSEFDGMLFTSAFEGMPNIVLEIAQRGLPIVAARVGGLSESFPPETLWYYDNGPSTSETARNAEAALLRLMQCECEAIVERVNAAAECVRVRHSRESFERELAPILDQILARQE